MWSVRTCPSVVSGLTGSPSPGHSTAPRVARGHQVGLCVDMVTTQHTAPCKLLTSSGMTRRCLLEPALCVQCDQPMRTVLEERVTVQLGHSESLHLAQELRS